jgi:1-deoxy-D-xylulose-5-phosphate synthase
MKKEPQHIDISTIKDPTFLKSLNEDELELLCADIRTEIIKETSIYGGHLSSNLGTVELTVALYRSFNFPKDKLIFDVGHQCYTHKILTGRSLAHLNEKNCVSGFEKMSESPYDCYEAGHSSTSLSAAEAFAIARDQKGDKYDVVALIGDASIVNGLSFEALNSIGSRPNKVIVVLNDNDMSIGRPSGGLGKFFRSISTGRAYNRFKRGYRRVMYRTRLGKKLYSFTYAIKSAIKQKLVPVTMFDNMGLTYIGPIDGHNIHALEKAFKRAKNTTKSVLIHTFTTKGKGYPYAEKDMNGYWHGVTPFDIETGQPKNLHPGYISWSHYFSDVTNEIMSKYQNSELIVPATQKGSGLEQAFQLYPSRCIDVGIAEEHALTLAGAMSLQGIHPIVAIYSTFLQRAYDELSHDCARMNANMTILIDRAGLVGSNGETHQGIYDEAFLKSIPHIVVTMPATQAEAKALYYQSFDNHGIVCIRYPRDFVSSEHDVMPVDMPFGRWRFLHKAAAKKVALIAVGPNETEIEKGLLAQNIDATLIDPVYLNPIDPNDIAELLPYEHVFIYDAYGTKEGFGSSVESALLEAGYKGKVHCHCVPNEFIKHATIKQQEDAAGLLPEQILSLVKAVLK